jgi:Fe-S-cluster-containing dehydrogenase component/formate-dependent nitrite reductase membrane component NrfD
VKFAKVLDQTRCIGCHACTTACKSENQVPLSVTRTYVKSVDVGIFPAARREFQVTRCNQCESAPCVVACPTSAMFKRSDGIVDFDKTACIGCKACIAACPYDAIFINPDDHSAEKCNFCTHRLDVGLEPACVVVCPVEAIFIGDLDDPSSKVAQVVGCETVSVRRPEKGTRPTVFYKGASHHTLDPLAATRPPGGIFAWAQQTPEGVHWMSAGAPARGGNASQASAILSYDIPHGVPWDWRVSLYTWTKSIAAGVYLIAAGLVLAGEIRSGDAVWRWTTPIVGLLFLALTGAVLIWDLEHPRRFYFICTRRQWRSWLVRGALVIASYGGVLTVHIVSSALNANGVSRALVVLGAPLAVLTAVYTAFLFGQARGRDLWQGSLLPAHLAVQTVLAGAAAVTLLTPSLSHSTREILGRVIAIAAGAHLFMAASEVVQPHGTEHARLAARNLVTGRLGRFFWVGSALAGVAVAGAWLPVIAAICALPGLLAYEHAYVQAAQSVPMA